MPVSSWAWFVFPSEQSDSHAFLYTVRSLDRENILSVCSQVLCISSLCFATDDHATNNTWDPSITRSGNKQNTAIGQTSHTHLCTDTCSLAGVIQAGYVNRPKAAVTNFPYFLANKFTFMCQFLQHKDNTCESICNGSSALGKKKKKKLLQYIQMLFHLQVYAVWIPLHVTGMDPLAPWMMKMRSVSHITYGEIQLLLFQI